jgi:hypothetical protein
MYSWRGAQYKYPGFIGTPVGKITEKTRIACEFRRRSVDSSG